MSQYTVDVTRNAEGVVETLTGNTGGAVPPIGGNINVIGTGSVNVAGDIGTATLTISVSGSGLSWNVITASSENMSVNNGYISNNAGVVSLLLPSTSVVGDYIAIIGFGAGGWSITQNAGQNIQIGSVSSSVGAGGSVSSTNRYDSIEIICVVANTTWIMLGAPQSTGLVVV